MQRRAFKTEDPIAVMDSGLGGISVLRELRRLMPGEDYIYFGDSKNAPYGEKPPETIRDLCRQNVEMLLERSAKCVVIACNTATSAAAEMLRREYPFLPVIGMEPAVKPAAGQGGHPRVLVLATPLTIKGDRLHHLVEAHADEAEFILREAPGIVRFVEEGVCDAAPSEALSAYLRELLSDFSEEPSAQKTEDASGNESRQMPGNKSRQMPGNEPRQALENSRKTPKKRLDAVVLGCTHFPFVKHSIEAALGYPAAVYDGAHGTALQTMRRLRECGLLRADALSGSGRVLLLNSDKTKLPAENMLLSAADAEEAASHF